MRVSRKRAGVVLAAALAVGSVGAVLGYWLGWVILVRVAEGRLVEVAARNLAVADSHADDARKALDDMNASPYPYCSHQELTFFRLILAQWQYPREGGRIRDGQIECSTILGRRNLPQEKVVPRYATPDGLLVYWDLGPLRLGNRPSLVLQQGRSFVVLSAQVPNDSLPAESRLHLTLLDPMGQPLNRTDPMDGTFDATGVSWRQGGLYGTRCSTRYLQCVTAELSTRSALRLGKPLFLVSSPLMGLCGAVLGFFLALTCCRSGTPEYDLRKAIRRDLLHMAYQPIVNLEDGRMVAVEALIRWTDREGLAVPPDVFVPIAEKEGFIGEITRFALRHLVGEMGSLLRADPEFCVSLNITGADLADEEFVPMLETTLAQAGIPPKSLMLEITETSTADHVRAAEAIHRLRACGHEVYIDDFGTGYSSLAYLRDLSVDGIKIDKIFTQAVGTGSLTVNLLSQIMAIAEVLGLEVVVEGIETEEQAQYFIARDKRMRAQGWLYGKAAPVDEILRILASDREQRMVASAVRARGQGRRGRRLAADPLQHAELVDGSMEARAGDSVKESLL